MSKSAVTLKDIQMELFWENEGAFPSRTRLLRLKELETKMISRLHRVAKASKCSGCGAPWSEKQASYVCGSKYEEGLYTEACKYISNKKG